MPRKFLDALGKTTAMVICTTSPDRHLRVTLGDGFVLDGGDAASHAALGQGLAAVVEKLHANGKSLYDTPQDTVFYLLKKSSGLPLQQLPPPSHAPAPHHL